MKTLLIFFSLLICNVIFAQGTKRFAFPVIGWTINMPADFVVSDSGKSVAYLNEGVTVLEKVSDIKVDASTTTVLIVANKNESYFSAIITPFDIKTEPAWEKQHADLKLQVYNAFKQALPKAVIDTVSSKQTIGGITFEKFVTTLSIDNKIAVTTVALSRLYKGFDFGITYSYSDKTTKEQMETMLSGSKFKK
jgi:hypothetical protein